MNRKYKFYKKNEKWFIDDLQLTILEAQTLAKSLYNTITTWPDVFIGNHCKNLIAAYYDICSLPQERKHARKQAVRASKNQDPVEDIDRHYQVFRRAHPRLGYAV